MKKSKSMIQLFKHTTVFLLLLTAALSINAQEVADSFDNCSQSACGFINVYNNAKSIPPIYCSASGFSEELAAVKEDEKWGYIDASNKVVIDFQFDYARSFKRSEEHTSELQSLMRTSYAVFCLKKKIQHMN